MRVNPKSIAGSPAPLTGPGPWPLHGAQASRELEARALSACAPMTLMNRAGASVARLALAVAPHAQRVVVLCGPGNNGGDGWVAAHRLHQAGLPVLVWEVLPARSADAQTARSQALAAGVPCSAQAPGAEPQLFGARILIIDALLGLGVQGELSAALGAAIHWIETAAAGQDHCTVLSVDLPSGLDADTGAPARTPEALPGAVRAHHTLSLLTLKPGLCTHEGREHAGRLWFDDLQVEVPAAPPTARWATSGVLAALHGGRRGGDGRVGHAGHKGSHGDAWVVGGSTGMAGAAQLAARAGLLAGAGRVYLVRLDGGWGDPQHPELMSRTVQQLQSTLAADTFGMMEATVVAGCGGGRDIAALLHPLLQRAARLVLDADALNAVAARDEHPALRAALQRRHARGLGTVLTPHPLEAARLLGCSTAEVQANRLKAAQALADELRCTVVLKGSGSVVASPGELPWINASGNARLATAGTGDVLAGWIGGAWASSAGQRQGHARASTASLHDLVAACVHLHGAAADAGVGTPRDSAVLPAGALVEEMALQLMAAAQGQHR